MGAFVTFLKSVVRLVAVVVAFLFFGYMQHQYGAGIIVSALLWVYLCRSGSRVISTIVVSGNVAAWYFDVKVAYVLTFLALDCLLLISESKSSDDTKVALRPYEAEVRKILFDNEPSLLHTVDSLLDQHKGREKELLYKLNKQYENGPVRTPQRSAQTPSAAPASAGYNAGPTRNGSVSRGNPTTPRSTYASVVLRIKRILERHDPALLPSLDRMLDEYKGREMDLLQEMQDEYETAESDLTPPASRTPGAGGSSFLSPTAARNGAGAGAGAGMSRSADGSSAGRYEYADHNSPLASDSRSWSAAQPYQPQHQTQQTQQAVRYDSDADDGSGASSPPVTHGRGAGVSRALQQRNDAVRQAQEEARREMQARIDARWGAKPASSGTAGVQKRQAYNYSQ